MIDQFLRSWRTPYSRIEQFDVQLQVTRIQQNQVSCDLIVMVLSDSLSPKSPDWSEGLVNRTFKTQKTIILNFKSGTQDSNKAFGGDNWSDFEIFIFSKHLINLVFTIAEVFWSGKNFILQRFYLAFGSVFSLVDWLISRTGLPNWSDLLAYVLEVGHSL